MAAFKSSLLILLLGCMASAAKTTPTGTHAASQHAAMTEAPTGTTHMAAHLAATSTEAPEATTEEPTTTAQPVDTDDTILNTRYCEVIPYTYQLYTYQCGNKTITVNATLQEVYNTVGHNYCPEDAWNNLTEEIANNAYGAYYSDLNGPRWWTLDHIQVSTNRM